MIQQPPRATRTEPLVPYTTLCRSLGITKVSDWKLICEYRNGIVLIVGATGSGKTTTLNATIREMDRLEKSIYTAEDPVEYRIPYVTHVQMNESVGLDFARSIKAFMRSDRSEEHTSELQSLMRI